MKLVEGDHEVVVDNLFNWKSTRNTKFFHDNLADIPSGIVYRVCTLDEFDSLKNNAGVTHSKATATVSKASSLLTRNGITVARSKELDTHHFTTEAKVVFENLLKSGLKLIKSKIRLMYASALVCTLISFSPDDYTDNLDRFEPFWGRNAVETLTNMWSSLIGVSRYYYATDIVYDDERVKSWCKTWGMNETTIRHLINSMRVFSIEASQSLKMKDFEFDVSDLTTHELNVVTGIATKSLNPVKSKKKWQKKHTPSKLPEDLDNAVQLGVFKYTPSWVVSNRVFSTYKLPEEDFSDL
jgi:hypothetical protein